MESTRRGFLAGLAALAGLTVAASWDDVQELVLRKKRKTYFGPPKWGWTTTGKLIPVYDGLRSLGEIPVRKPLFGGQQHVFYDEIVALVRTAAPDVVDKVPTWRLRYGQTFLPYQGRTQLVLHAANGSEVLVGPGDCSELGDGRAAF